MNWDCMVWEDAFGELIANASKKYCLNHPHSLTPIIHSPANLEHEQAGPVSSSFGGIGTRTSDVARACWHPARIRVKECFFFFTKRSFGDTQRLKERTRFRTCAECREEGWCVPMFFSTSQSSQPAPTSSGSMNGAEASCYPVRPGAQGSPLSFSGTRSSELSALPS